MSEQQHEPTELISTELERIHQDSYGTGAHRIHTHIVGDRFVLCVVDNHVTVAERTLLDSGQGEAVKATRMAFQEAIGPTFIAVVERAVGRRVEAFVSHVHLDPMFTVEMFRLAPLEGEHEELE
ncbi:MAG: hypothetical protein QOE06_860 [Thermoleophilaceae bacterium]|nr:hypothetical protein [Thermoleophilaceae bacterium]